MSNIYRGGGERDANEPAEEAANDTQVSKWSSQWHCPGCSVPLLGMRLGRDRVYGCERCSGAWLKEGAASRVLEVRGADGVTPTELVPANESGGAGMCPCCRVPLSAMHALPRRALVHVCREHGVWIHGATLVACMGAVAVPLRALLPMVLIGLRAPPYQR